MLVECIKFIFLFCPYVSSYYTVLSIFCLDGRAQLPWSACMQVKLLDFAQY